MAKRKFVEVSETDIDEAPQGEVNWHFDGRIHNVEKAGDNDQVANGVALVVLVIAFVIGMYVYRQRSLEVAVGLSCAVAVFSAFVIQTVTKLVKNQ